MGYPGEEYVFSAGDVTSYTVLTDRLLVTVTVSVCVMRRVTLVVLSAQSFSSAQVDAETGSAVAVVVSFVKGRETLPVTLGQMLTVTVE